MQVLSYRLGVFEEAEVNDTSAHSLVGFSFSLLSGLVPVTDALLDRLTEKPSFINNIWGWGGGRRGRSDNRHFKWEPSCLRHLGKAVHRPGSGMCLPTASECSSSSQFGCSHFIIPLTSLTSRMIEALIVSAVFIFHILFLYLRLWL